IGHALPAAQVKARKKTAERVVAALERLPARGQAGIEPGVDPEPVDHALAGVPPPKPFVHVSGPVSASFLGTRASSLADLPGPEKDHCAASVRRRPVWTGAAPSCNS